MSHHDLPKFIAEATTSQTRKRFPLGLLVVTGLMLGATGAQAATVTANLGASAEDFVENGLGPDIATGRGTYALDQGACLYDGTNTTCTLSGSFTSDLPGFMAGTYTYVTAYAGTGLSPIRAISSVGDPEFFNYTAASPSTSMTMNLTTPGSGTFVQAVVSGGFFDPAVIGLTYTTLAPYICSGAAVGSCSASSVGLTNGAIGKAKATTTVQFTTVVPLPPTLYLLGTALGLVGTRVAGKRQARRSPAV
ncbi:MAG: hypothetical protein ABI661_01560 [Gammaproteobacteria bacterium]